MVRGDRHLGLLAARRAEPPGVGLMSGGYGEEELGRAHAFGVYGDPAGLRTHIDELAVRGP